MAGPASNGRQQGQMAELSEGVQPLRLRRSGSSLLTIASALFGDDLPRVSRQMDLICGCLPSIVGVRGDPDG